MHRHNNTKTFVKAREVKRKFRVGEEHEKLLSWCGKAELGKPIKCEDFWSC